MIYEEDLRRRLLVKGNLPQNILEVEGAHSLVEREIRILHAEEAADGIGFDPGRNLLPHCSFVGRRSPDRGPDCGPGCSLDRILLLRCCRRSSLGSTLLKLRVNGCEMRG